MALGSFPMYRFCRHQLSTAALVDGEEMLPDLVPGRGVEPPVHALFSAAGLASTQLAHCAAEGSFVPGLRVWK